MTKSLVAVSLTLMMFAALPASAAPKSSGGDAEFKDLIRQYYEAWNSLTTDKPAPLYAKDASLVFFDIAPLKYTGWEEYKAGVQKNFFDQMTSGKLTANNDLKVSRKGGVAWTTVTGHLSGKMKDGKSMEVDFRQTAIWEKTGGKWLIVHEHFSAPMM